MLNNRIASYLRHQSFQPDVVSVLINPFYFLRRNLKNGIQHFSSQIGGKLLDFGCGRKPFENLFSVSQYIGLDIEQTGHDHSYSKVDVYYDGKHIPFPNETFDALFCSEVLEHVFNPNEVLPEIHRVLKKDALALITVPFCWNEHEIPFDYARYSSFGISDLLQKNGFKVLQLKKSGNFVQVLFQLWALYFFELFKKWGRAGYILSLLFIAPINIIGTILSPLFPVNHTLYFNNIVLAQKIS
jgi:SAM-dependent methyltransferase